MIRKTYIPAKPRNKKLIGRSIPSSNGVAAGGGGSTGGGLTSEQLEILSFWKKDPDNPNTIFTEMNAYSKLELSAYGVGDGGGGGGSDYERLDTWASYDSSKAGWVLSAFLGNDLNTRVTSIDGRVTNLENSGGGGGGSTVEWGTLTNGYRQLTVEGVTYALAQNTHKHLWADITDKPSTFTPSAHTHSAGDITSGTFSIARIPTGTTGTTVALGNHLHTGVYEPVFSKNTAFNKDFGTTSGTVAQGNDSRIINGQTAFGWGNHASAGYALNSSLNLKANLANPTFTGVVGIGVSSAYSKLHIGGTGLDVPIGDITMSRHWADETNTRGSSIFHFFDSNLQRDMLVIGVSGVGGSNNAPNQINQAKLSILASGNVGIGTITPQHKLDVSGTGRFIGNVTAPTFIGSLTGNAATATKLQTARTIWGQSFDGTGDVTGALSGATTIAASTSVTSPKVIFSAAGWSMEQTGTELLLKYNNSTAARFLADGSIVGLGEITAYGATTGGDGVSLLRTGGTMTGNLTMSADIIMNSGRAIGISNLPLKLLGNALTYNASNVLTEANTATQIKMGNGWTIEQTTSALTIKKNGVVKGTFNA